MAVSRRLRFEILRRDGMACRYCGAKAPDVTLTVDHVVPVALGGGDEPNNLVTACQDCNSGKSSVPADAALVDEVDATALMFAKALERASEIRQRDLKLVEQTIDYVAHIWQEAFGDLDQVPDDWPSSIERFIGLGFDAHDFRRYVEVTARKFGWRSRWGHWRYFCGCVYTELGDRQELARQLIEDGEV